MTVLKTTLAFGMGYLNKGQAQFTIMMVLYIIVSPTHESFPSSHKVFLHRDVINQTVISASGCYPCGLLDVLG